MKIKVRFAGTERYEFSHGVKPRGAGNWWFDVLWSNGRGGYTSDQVCFPGSYTSAKQSAKQYAQSHNKPFGAADAVVEVMP